jgi:hemerythrin
MEKIKWLDTFSVGVEEIDIQHKKLIEIINELIDHRDVNSDSEVISETLNKMTDYIKYHFSYEEEYLKEINYPELVIHELEHLDFIEKTTNFCIGTLNVEKNISEDILQFLKDWLINHILKSDMKYKEYKETLQ